MQETQKKSAPLVLLQNVSQIFGAHSTNPVPTLQDINLQIYPGEFVTLIGPSGCGKSTLLRLVAALLTPSHGTVQVNGKPALRARQSRDYGIVFQTPVLFEWRTIQRNVELPLEIMHLPHKERRERAKQMLELVELGNFAKYYPWQLSGGMQQRAAIARALVFKPALLLMDEPFGALDEITRERMNSELLNLWRRTQTTVIFVTHSISEAVFLSTRVLVMSTLPGRIRQQIDIDLPPRSSATREDPRYFALVTQVREALRATSA